MKKYPEEVMRIYNIFLDYTEKVESVIDRLNMENERMAGKLMKLREQMNIDAEAGDEEEAEFFVDVEASDD